jgi:lipid-A-disaccharide synthase
LKYYLIAGERSGDLHASNLIKSLIKEDAAAEFRFLGGEMMQAAGGTMYRHYKEISFMGFWEVFSNLGAIFKNLKYCKADLIDYKPDVLILVDFSGFNLRVAAEAKKAGIKVYYYISPKIWAWNQSRAHKIKRLVDKMFVIIPFEKEFYKKFDFEVDYVGNPVFDAIHDFVPNPNFRQLNQLDNREIIAVLPGSRQQEVVKMLHYMINVVPVFRKYQFVVAAVSNLSEEYYEMFNRDRDLKIIYEQSYDILANAKAAIVTSGTATLETALFNVPQVVCYKTSAATYLIVKALIKVKFISLVNLIVNKPVVKELIQDEFVPRNLVDELTNIVENEDFIRIQKQGYSELKSLIGGVGASDTTAKLMLKYLRQ